MLFWLIRWTSPRTKWLCRRRPWIRSMTSTSTFILYSICPSVPLSYLQRCPDDQTVGRWGPTVIDTFFNIFFLFCNLEAQLTAANKIRTQGKAMVIVIRGTWTNFISFADVIFLLDGRHPIRSIRVTRPTITKRKEQGWRTKDNLMSKQRFWKQGESDSSLDMGGF